MKITAYVPLSQHAGILDFQSFIVETFFFLTRQFPDHNYIIITHKSPGGNSFPVNTEIIIKPQPGNVILKKLWWDVKLLTTLKKFKADLFISFENACSLTASIPQMMVVDDSEKIKPAYLKKARLLIVNSELAKRKLIDKHTIDEKKISVIYPSASMLYNVIKAEEKELIKKEFSEGKEFFLYNGIINEGESFINLLKSFSHFKKRQQSSFKLLLSIESNSFFEKSLVGYKYRNDVKFVGTKNENELALLTAAAYSVVLPFDSGNDLIPALNAMKSGVPVIATKNSAISEVAEDAALYANAETTRDLGEKMMQVYTDEDHRSTLIKKGIDVTSKFSQGKATGLLWQAINSALK
jgi:glycosyltransferase involved in cell wall biosynthesis